MTAPVLLWHLNREDYGLPNFQNIPRPQWSGGKLCLKKCFGEKTEASFLSSCRVRCSSEVRSQGPSKELCSRPRSTFLVGLTVCMTHGSPTKERRVNSTQTCSWVFGKALSPHLCISWDPTPHPSPPYPRTPRPWWIPTGISHPENISHPGVRLRRREGAWPPHLMCLSPHSLLDPGLC